MTSHIFGPGSVGPGFHAASSHEKAAGSIGEWNGLAVTVGDDPASLLADAAEELTFAASETVEKEVTERKKPNKEKRIATVVPPTEAMDQLQQHMAERLAKLLQAIKKSMGNLAGIMQAIEEFGGDPTERHAAFCWLEEQVVDTPDLVALINEQRENLERESANEIQAGYNTCGIDATVMGGIVNGRDTYRRTILGNGDMASMLDDVLERHGSANFLEIIDFLCQAVGSDLSATTPSTDKRELEAINNDLYHLRALGNFIREFDADVTKLREDAGKKPLPEVGLATVRLFSRAKDERVIVLESLKPILGLEGEKDIVYDIHALTKAHHLAHNLPHKLFIDQDSRQRLLDAAQKLLDDAVDLEEALMEGE